LIYLSSDMHVSGRAELDDLDWTKRRWNGTQAYCDSKLHVTTFAFAIAARWPKVRVHRASATCRAGTLAPPARTRLGHRDRRTTWRLLAADGSLARPVVSEHCIRAAMRRAPITVERMTLRAGSRAAIDEHRHGVITVRH
jgi:hypothetical protein